MGSYEVTCNISQLPITGGTPVRVLFLGKCPYSMDDTNEAALGEGNNSREGCYSTDFWYPRMVPLKAEYYDYGQVQKVEGGLNQILFWEQLVKDLWKVDQGPNPFHDPASSHNMDWDRMWDVVTEGRLRIKRKHVSREDGHKATPVCAVMIREDAWQAMLALENPWKDCGRRDGYRPVSLTLKYYKAKITEVAKEVLATPVSDWEREYMERNPDFQSFRYSLLQDLFLDSNNPAGALGLEFYFKSLIEAVEVGEYTLECPEIQDMFQRIAEVQHVKNLYSALRRTWHPGTGQGSQSVEFLAEAQFHHAMAMIGYRAADQERKQRAKWDREVDENNNIIPPKPVERMDGDAFLACLQLPEETD